MPAEPIEEIHDVLGEAHAYGHIADGVFEDEIPADDPGDDFAHGGVGVGIRAAGNRNHRGEFGVTDGSKPAHDGDEHKRESNRRTGTRTAKRRRAVNQIFQKRSV